jgi:hypothetical protein
MRERSKVDFLSRRSLPALLDRRPLPPFDRRLALKRDAIALFEEEGKLRQAEVQRAHALLDGAEAIWRLVVVGHEDKGYNAPARAACLRSLIPVAIASETAMLQATLWNRAALDGVQPQVLFEHLCSLLAHDCRNGRRGDVCCQWPICSPRRCSLHRRFSHSSRWHCRRCHRLDRRHRSQTGRLSSPTWSARGVMLR